MESFEVHRRDSCVPNQDDDFIPTSQHSKSNKTMTVPVSSFPRKENSMDRRLVTGSPADVSLENEPSAQESKIILSFTLLLLIASFAAAAYACKRIRCVVTIAKLLDRKSVPNAWFGIVSFNRANATTTIDRRSSGENLDESTVSNPNLAKNMTREQRKDYVENYLTTAVRRSSLLSFATFGSFSLFVCLVLALMRSPHTATFCDAYGRNFWAIAVK